ncbi:ABC transporter permease [Prosthecomicrobium sp. N25]|uniref:ABC transporter permease n=1 Tax=Prosthecomicrobium sp. N25 TaxID=3129254 RepID=UPI003078A39A
MRLGLRLLRAAISLWVIVTLVFVALRLTGDPVLAVLNPDDLTRDVIESFRRQWGFEGTIWDQYVVYLVNVAHGHFGRSTMNGQDALTVVLERVPATLQLVGCSALVMLGVGVPLGTIAALRPGSRLDGLVMAATTLGFALPNFFLGLLLILTFSVWLSLLPSGGTGSAAHLVMPVLTIGLAKAAIFTRFVRSGMIDALRLPCITAARARGLSETAIMVRHVAPNCLIPLVTILPLLVGAMISAGSVVEAVFAWPGIGRLIVESVAQRNLAVVQVIILLVAILMVTTNLIVDILYGWLDPRTAAAVAH